jgi:uncharacterized protein YcbK (DUF882 family)
MEREGHFQDWEIRCRCGCVFIKVVPYFLYKINWLRDIVDQPLTVTSWCRCQPYNAVVGGEVTSSHPKGLAVDLFTPTEYLKYRILLAAGEVHFRGVGVATNFIHLDDDYDKPPNRFWLY